MTWALLFIEVNFQMGKTLDGAQTIFGNGAGKSSKGAFVGSEDESSGRLSG